MPCSRGTGLKPELVLSRMGEAEMQISTSSGKIFQVSPEETILDAAMSAGIVLEHSCRTGRCGSCKAYVGAGLTIPTIDEIGLSQADQEAGWILTCARTAKSDVSLDVEDLGDIKIYPAKTIPCRIQLLDRLSKDVLRVVLRLPPNQQLEYHPGQYIDLIGKDGLRRSYSIANSPSEDKLLELHIRQVPEGAMSKYWFEEAKSNDLLRLNGPLGTFFIRDVAGLDLLLLATGTGIAPIKAILQRIAVMPQESHPKSISVYWGGRVQDDLYWNPEELGLDLNYFPVLSRANSLWTGLRGYVQEAVLNSGLDLRHAAVYACGSTGMIDSARAQLVTGGLDRRLFYSDAFVPSSQK